MSEAIVRDTGSGAAMLLAQGQMLDIALRAAAQLKNARGMLPESLKSEGEIVAVLLAGQELGLPAMVSLRGLQVVRGKIIISYDTMIALLRRAGYRIAWPVSTATCATLRLTAPDGEIHTETWDEARAKKAGLWGSGVWAKFPDTMLRARCVSSAARAFAGEVLSGVYVEGEIDEQPRGASTGSPEVRVLGDAVHEADEAPAGPDPFAHAHHALTQCKTDGDLRAWSRAFGEAIERAPDDDNRRGVWAAAKRKARGVVPPIQVATLTAWFLEDRQARAAKASPVTLDGEVLDPLAAALDRLPECETREMLIAWTSENAATLAAIPHGSAADVEAWGCIRARCELVGGIDAEELERLL